jgi:plasmid replication initiation protein
MTVPRMFQIGDRVKVIAIPPDLHDAARIGTLEVFQRALGRTFRVEGIGEHGHLELVVSRADTIWIEPEFVEAVDDGTRVI